MRGISIGMSKQNKNTKKPNHTLRDFNDVTLGSPAIFHKWSCYLSGEGQQ